MSLIEVWLSDHNAIVREKLRRITVERMVPLLSRIVEQGVEEGTFIVSSPTETARVLVMLLQGFQDGATELFVARQKRLISYEDVKRRMATFAEAFGKDPDFFAFYRSMSAYEQGLKANDTRFLLRPDSDFFRFFGSASGKPGGTAAAPAAPKQ